jgi:hypothetical protein
MKDIEGLILKYGPALIEVNENPFNSNAMMSQSPEGVFFITSCFVILEFGNIET